MASKWNQLRVMLGKLQGRRTFKGSDREYLNKVRHVWKGHNKAIDL